MHRFYRNAENPGICVYKEKRTQAVNTTQSTDTAEHKKFSKIHATTQISLWYAAYTNCQDVKYSWNSELVDPKSTTDLWIY